MKLGLALSGGGIRGAVHIGVLKALEEKNIKIDIIGGTSSGSLVASLYAMGYSPMHIYQLFIRYGKAISKINKKTILNEVGGYIVNKKFKISGINDGKVLEDMYNNLAKKKNVYKIEDIKMPIAIPTVDLKNGKEYIFTNKKQVNSEYQKYIMDASIGTAVRASSSFPAVFCPYEYKNHIFLDGGTTDNIPVNEVFNLGADKVITVKFDPISINDKSNVMDIVMRTIDIMGNKIIEKELEKSDYILTIPTENDIGLLDIDKIKDCYKCGYETTINNIEKIKAIIF